MITEPEIFCLPTITGERIDIMCNWREGIDGKFVKMRIDGGEWVMIERHAFIRAAMFLGEEKEQEELIPTRQIKRLQLGKSYTVVLKKDFKQGQSITIPVKMDVEIDEEGNLVTLDDATRRNGIIGKR